MADPASDSVAPCPAEIGGYTDLRVLTPGATYTGLAPGGRRVVLKMLDADCLLRGGLHPSIRDRLGRVRELAHMGVANLHGVERDGDWVYLVWEYVAGSPFADALAPPDASDRDVLLLARELALTVEALNARGIVHGAIRGSNVLVDADKRLRLTHVSPLLYSDPAADVEAVLEVLGETAAGRGGAPSLLGRLVAEFAEGTFPDQPPSARARSARAPAGEAPSPSLRALVARLTAMLDLRESPLPAVQESPADARPRRRALLGAAAVAAVAFGLYAGLRHYAGHAIAKAPAPPEASPAAM